MRVGYAASGAGVAYRYAQTEGAIELDVEWRGAEAAIHLLLPDGFEVSRVELDGESLPYHEVAVGESRYVDIELSKKDRGSLRVNSDRC